MSEINFFCMGYDPDLAGPYLGLDRWSIGHLCALLVEEATLGDDERELVLAFVEHYFEPYGEELRTLGPEWFTLAEQMLRLAPRLAVTSPGAS
jgi:hypothetical protein